MLTVSFAYIVPKSGVDCLKDALDIMYIPYWIEQSSDKWKLAENEVAFAFPEVHPKVFAHICELFTGYELHDAK